MKWEKLQSDVVRSNLCTHCGTCVGLNDDKLEMIDSEHGPIPKQKTQGILDPITYFACPGKGVPYPAIYDFLHGTEKHNFLSGKVVNSWIGYSTDNKIRLNSASGGVITSTLLYLLNKRLIDGAIVVLSGTPNPEDAVPIIATTEKEIISSAQSVYLPVPVNKILGKSKNIKGKLAFVGLPDQVASIRMLQMEKHPSVSNIEYILGPYTGTNMYKGAIRSFLRGRGVKDSAKISSLKWRAGEWPGYLEIILEDGRIFKAEKFYYNYLTPFFITKSTLLGCDFTNELTDISVGDAWSPVYEKQGKGFSVILSRTKKGDRILKEMYEVKEIELKEIELNDALTMHGHMLDFKKRGSFIRIKMRKMLGKKVPYYGYKPKDITFSRKLVELIVSFIFDTASSKISRKISELIPLKVLGPAFNYLRINWKRASKLTKRKGLLESEFIIDENELNLLSIQNKYEL